MERWESLKEIGSFEQDKANLALLAIGKHAKGITPRTVKEAVSSDVATLATVRKYMGEETIKDAVIETIAFASAMLNIGKNLQPHQIEFLADEILNEYYWMKLAEIKFVMMQGIKGNYGELYDCLDFRTVMAWMARYDAERTEIVEHDSQRAHIEFKEMESETAIFMPDELKELAAKLDNTFLVDGELKKGFTTGEFEPDEPTLRMIEMEWADLPEETRQPYENYKAMRIAHLKAQMKK